MLPIAYPFPSEISPHAATLDDASLLWAKQLGIVGTAREEAILRSTQAGMLVARAYPHGRPGALQLMTDWINWGFLWDDKFDASRLGQTPDDMEPIIARIPQILSGAPVSEDDSPAEKALSDLYARMMVERPNDARWIERFRCATSEDNAAFLWEARNRSRGVVPSVAEYHRMRMFTSAAYSCFIFSELVDDIELPEEVHKSSTLKQIELHANTVLSWYNDLFSLAKELSQGDVHNIVLVVMHERQCSLDEAKAIALAEHDAHLAEFLRLQQELPSFGPAVDAQLRRYLDSIGRWMKGQLDWSLAVQRYKTSQGG